MSAASRILATLLAVTVFLFAVSAVAGPTLTDGGASVTIGHTVWLSNMDLPAALPLTVPLCADSAAPNCINSSGSMNYGAAKLWVAALNSYIDPGYRTVGYLGRSNWQLPATQSFTAGCGSVGKHGESFGYGCGASALGSIYQAMGLVAPASAAGNVSGGLGSFTNLQPNYYWTQTAAGSGGSDGFKTFSFATGWSGANQGANHAGKNPDANFFYLLPMIDGDAGVAGTVYDPASGKSWLADGDIAATDRFGLPLCVGLGSATSKPCVNKDGTMTETSAEAFIDAMNKVVINGKKGYLGITDWTLPDAASGSCSYAACAGAPTNNPLASLYYNLLGLSAGDSVANPYSDSAGLFSDVQPYLYWSCQGASETGPATASACSESPQCSPLTEPNPCGGDMEWSYNFGDGFQGTDEEANDLFVTALSTSAAPEPVTWAMLLLGVAAVGRALRRRNRGDAVSRSSWLCAFRSRPSRPRGNRPQ
ncbi:MAG TPA: PEPxxWA-CTERM sorting domain-containing protein [Caulobacteraceae bacterium]|nr:PEPxxWA-CTERM sorting domain-containing protein [Caulobacteraceae bacterium]